MSKKKKKNTIEFLEVSHEDEQSNCLDMGFRDGGIFRGTVIRMPERDVRSGPSSAIAAGSMIFHTSSGRPIGIASSSADPSSRTVEVITSGCFRMLVSHGVEGAVSRVDGSTSIMAGDIVQSSGMMIGIASADAIEGDTVNVSLFDTNRILPVGGHGDMFMGVDLAPGSDESDFTSRWEHATINREEK